VEFGKHLGKGIWGFADKVLPVLYGAGYVLLVIRVLPEEEFGNFVLVQEVFLVLSALAAAFGLQPLLKFAAEEGGQRDGVVTIAFVLHAAFLAVASAVLFAVLPLLPGVLNAPTLAPLLPYIPALLAASLLRNFALALLQSRFMIREVFWVDAFHFVGAPFLVWVVSRLHLFDSALDLVAVNIVSLGASSLAGLWLIRSTFRLTARVERDDLRRMWEYGSYSLGSIISFQVYTRSDTFILAAFTGPVQVAVYNSVKVFVRVYEMVAQVVQMFVLPATARLASLGERASLRALLEKAVLFLTVALVPVTLLFLLAPAPLLRLIYGMKYADAAPLLPLFGLLTFAVPLLTVCSNVLLGLGEAKKSFLLGLLMFGVSVGAEFALIPWGGGTGAAAAYVLASFFMALATAGVLHSLVPVSPRGILSRVADIRAFVATNLGRRLR
jgi:O-antigen/teichoic acid export membrane protein